MHLVFFVLSRYFPKMLHHISQNGVTFLHSLMVRTLYNKGGNMKQLNNNIIELPLSGVESEHCALIVDKGLR